MKASFMFASLHVFVVIGISNLQLTLGYRIQAERELGTNQDVNDVSHLLEPLLEKYDAPALGGLLLDVNRTLSIGACGVRKRGTKVNVTFQDHWHLGSNTKAMTATLVARLVEAGTVSWNDTVGRIFSRLNLRQEFNSINFIHLLSHHSGIPANTDWHGLSLSAPTLVGQRVNCIKVLNNTELLAEPGTEYRYSNWGYTVAGAMLEEVTGKSYEELMQQHIFDSLGMISAGFGPTSGADQPELTQPWGHQPGGTPWQADNPLVMSPAGTVHCSLEDWAKFVSDHLRGHLGMKAELKPETYAWLHKVPFTNDYALGWLYGWADWAKGPILWHNGGNTGNFAIMAIDFEAGIAVMSSSNQGDQDVAADQVLRILVTEGQQHQIL